MKYLGSPKARCMKHKTQLARLGLFDVKVPRYTSYPTAAQFRDTVGPGDYARWMTEIPENARVSLYVHIPFCRRLCWFCACRTQGTNTESPVRAYLDMLRAELALIAQHLPKGVTLSRLHWGGGTPTLLNADMITELAGLIHDVVPMHETGEFSVEIDPNELDQARLDALVAAGMGRASIGVQDFDPEIQKTIGRIQGFDITRDVVEMIRNAGIASINADILFGLPHQSRARITESVQKLLALSPDRVALYGYAHVPWMAKRQQMIPTESLPTPEARLDLFETARQMFLWDGYDEIGIDHFARPDDSLALAQKTGTLRRNFQGYTDDPADVLIGVGASSISRFPQGFTQNAVSTSQHMKAISDGRFSVAKGHVFAGQDNLRAAMIERLMCDFGFDISEMAAEFGVPVSLVQGICTNALRPYSGYVQQTESRVRILPEGRALTRIIARAFDAYELSKLGHSSAI